jgi:hypothetical protein
MLPLHARPPLFGPNKQEAATTATAAATPACAGDTAVVFVVNPMPAKQTAPSGLGASSGLGSFADAVATVKTLAQNLPQPAPWRNMADSDGWHKPRTAEQARAKMTHNVSKFGINYGYIVCACALASLCLSPLVAFVVASAAAASAWIMYDTRNVGVTMLRGVTRVQRQGAAAALCIAAVLFSGAASVACTGALVGTIACAAHGACYEPPVDFGG